MALCAQIALNGVVGTAHADGGAGDVVINEVAWAGSIDNSNDEWIELYNATSQAIDLSGWYVEDDYSLQYVIKSGVVSPHGYFLIEDVEESVSNVSSDALIGLSLANSGDTLILKNADGVVIDSVNSGGGAWYAGNNTSKASMERIDPSVILDTADNFATAESGNGGKSSGGSAIIGTPKGQNSVYQGSDEGVSVEFDLSNETPLTGETVTATVIVNNSLDLFAYGFDVVYDSSVLSYVGVSEEGFLSENGQVSTAFNYGLEDGDAGKLVVGNARLVSPASGVSGSGNLFTVTFEVLGDEGASSDLVFGGASFLSNSEGDVLASFSNGALTVGSNQIDSVTELVAGLGDDVYSLALNWIAPASGADSYLIFRKDVDGNLVQIGTSTEGVFVDDDDLNFGGDLVPGIEYEYQVRAVKNGIQSAGVAVLRMETRGLVGDNNRSGRIDGRDVENLARHYGTLSGDEEYAALVDTTYDGVIDGSDLIYIGANFGLTF